MKKIFKMIENELAHHPACTLQDIYKLFMQSTCGPGHIITDTYTAMKYLLQEIAENKTYISKFDETSHKYLRLLKPQYISFDDSSTTCPCLILECDAKFPLARYSLQIVQDGVIPLDRYFKAFIDTANTCKRLDYEPFCKNWREVVVYLTEIGFTFTDEDRQQIEQILYKLVRHSPLYNQLYQPSYRIINKNYLAEYDNVIREMYFQ